MSNDALKKLDSHFAFGENWASYSKLIGEPQIARAQEGLLKLVPAEEFKDRSFLDIGCGSGLHALAASRLGVSRVVGADIDPNSAATAKKVLSDHSPNTPWQIENISVFDLTPEKIGTFDIVYSWGVLHHTGNVWQAVSKAAALVVPGGLFAIALYRETYLDSFWKLEKRLYAKGGPLIQNFLKSVYVGVFRITRAITGRGSFSDYLANYKSKRGMDFDHDVHDWLGGYPYESASAQDVDRHLTALGFKAERIFVRPKSIGIFGSGCDEYVYRLMPKT